MSDQSDQKVSRRTLAFTSVVVASASAVFLFVRLRTGEEPRFASSQSMQVNRDMPVEIGGIRRPSADIAATGVASSKELETARRVSQSGELHTQQVSGLVAPRSISITRETNAAAAALIDAYANGTNPERLTPTVLPAAFEPQSYESNPSVYLDSAEPGRVWQTAQPGPGVTPLRRRGDASLKMRQFESVRLAVRAKPGVPVSFTAFDGGVFDNSLPMISIAADSDGTATAVYTAASGVVEEVKILAGSPLHSGHVEFIVNVEEAVASR